ncbi:hypothetical protein MMC27_004735 [Xylographa pallens]|nr:hypothetical protein [Xylographa pallens]
MRRGNEKGGKGRWADEGGPPPPYGASEDEGEGAPLLGAGEVRVLSFSIDDVPAEPRPHRSFRRSTTSETHLLRGRRDADAGHERHAPQRGRRSAPSMAVSCRKLGFGGPKGTPAPVARTPRSVGALGKKESPFEPNFSFPQWLTLWLLLDTNPPPPSQEDLDAARADVSAANRRALIAEGRVLALEKDLGDHARVLAELNTKHREATQRLRGKLQQFEREHHHTIHNVNEKHAHALQQQNEKHGRTVKQLKDENVHALQQLEEEHGRTFQQQAEKHGCTLKQLMDENAHTLQQLKEEHGRALQQLKEQQQLLHDQQLNDKHARELRKAEDDLLVATTILKCSTKELERERGKRQPEGQPCS